jgi:hypothetical protein
MKALATATRSRYTQMSSRPKRGDSRAQWTDPEGSTTQCSTSAFCIMTSAFCEGAPVPWLKSKNNSVIPPEAKRQPNAVEGPLVFPQHNVLLLHSAF